MTNNYPTAQTIADLIQERLASLPTDNKVDVDELVYEVISTFDDTFSNDPQWFQEEGYDIKDELRDQVMTAFAWRPHRALYEPSSNQPITIH